MPLTPYHAKLFAHELTRRLPSDSVEKLTAALADAQVDLNPHQIEAALFAFRSPFSNGAVLADEVGLGKTIEAGILLAQRWAEGKRRLLVICPANLRKQWGQELSDKFFLPSTILETRTFNEAVHNGNLNPFETTLAGRPRVVLCSYQFARAKEPYVRQTPWDLVVVDEAHRLRNVYKPGNKIANAIKVALANRHKLLLTATPLQNSLLELYGLVSVIDEFTFGDLRSFKLQFAGLGRNSSLTQEEWVEYLDLNPASSDRRKALEKKVNSHKRQQSQEYADLKRRLQSICQRTLRKDVLQYVQYTRRHALVQEFVPSADEQRLYNLVSEYLQQPTLYALPSSQRQLMTLILRKLLASSTYAISDTLLGLANKLETAEREAKEREIPEGLADNFELLPELEDEWQEDDDDTAGDSNGNEKPVVELSPEQREARLKEMGRLREFHQLARSIQRNSKGEVLLTALQRGFEKAREAQAGQASALQQKAIIFTESRRTQEYLLRLLEQTEFAGKIVLFNGTNTDAASQQIYRDWMVKNKDTDRITGSPTADKRAALVEHFRDYASIMIATEAAAEGINLQFCNLVVNYDLPWNPQRIEQRIGRCHRYGQKFDVVVVNFLNKQNAADVRVYQLLDEKFRLFDGVFGASDEVLGAIESGLDFEKRIAQIYQQCRTPQQITLQFDELQQTLAAEITEARSNAQEQLLNNFDQEVIDRVRVESASALTRFDSLLWRLTRHYLADYADFAAQGYEFVLRANPFPTEEKIDSGPYRMGKNVEEAHTYRVRHPLAQRILATCCELAPEVDEVRFQLAKSGRKIAALEPLAGKSGWLECRQYSIEGLEAEDHVLLTGVADDGSQLDAAQCRRLFDLDGEAGGPVLSMQPAELAGRLANEQERVDRERSERGARWLDEQATKLDRWAEDRKLALETELKELDLAIKEMKRASREAALLADKVARQKELKRLEALRAERRADLFTAQDRVEQERDTMIASMERRMAQTATVKPLFKLRWSIQ